MTLPGSAPSLQQLCELARLQAPSDGGREVTERLGRVLQAFQELAQVHTEGVAPTLYPLPLELRTRPDAAGKILEREAVMSNAPRTAAGCFQVPRVVEA
jgi:aspartyl/glutamyl-tRNA(Asn/Gln) amidotransferase C subunit